MPKNNNLDPVNLPMDIKFNKPPRTEFKDNLESIHVELLEGPDISDIMRWIPNFIDATWSEDPCEDLSKEIKYNYVKEMFEGKALPGARETINFVFRIEGISLQEVTHILRHRMATFSADCAGYINGCTFYKDN